MKKNVLFNSKTALYTLAIFVINVLFLPDNYLLFDTIALSIRENDIVLCVLVALAVLLLSAVSAMVIHKIFSSEDKFIVGCGMLLLADILFRHTALNLVHLIFLSVSVILALVITEGKKLLPKTLLTAALALVLPVLSPESAFCQVPLVLVAYSFALTKANEEIPTVKNKKGNTKKTTNRIKETVLVAGMTALGIFLGVLLEENVASVIAASDYNADAFANFSKAPFWIGFIPYAILLVAFVCIYFANKSKEQKKSVGQVIVQSDFVWLTILSIGLVLYGIIVEKLYSSITVFNVIMVETVILLYLHNDKSSCKSAEGVFGFCNKYRYAVFAVFAVWFFVTQFVLKNVQFSLLDRMLSMVGGTL